jgi:hypothetical protein
MSVSNIFPSKWLSVTQIIDDSIQFTLILLLLLILDNDIHQNPGPEEYEFSVFHLNARSVRNKLSYLEDNICRKGKVTGLYKHADQIL